MVCISTTRLATCHWWGSMRVVHTRVDGCIAEIGSMSEGNPWAVVEYCGKDVFYIRVELESSGGGRDNEVEFL